MYSPKALTHVVSFSLSQIHSSLSLHRPPYLDQHLAWVQSLVSGELGHTRCLVLTHACRPSERCPDSSHSFPFLSCSQPFPFLHRNNNQRAMGKLDGLAILCFHLCVSQWPEGSFFSIQGHLLISREPVAKLPRYEHASWSLWTNRRRKVLSLFCPEHA